jgi:hypothetical protein
MPKGFFKQDEDLDFVMDSYQSGFSSMVFNEDFKARSAVMKKIARRRAPQTLPLLEQIEHIVTKVKNGEMKEKTGMKKLLEISEAHGHPDLHEGILQKVGMINGASQFKPLAAFAKKQKEEQHPIAKFKKAEKHEKMGWDPLTEDHPMAILMKQQKKEKPLMAELFKQKKNEGWDPMTEDHPLAAMFKKTKEKPMIPAGFFTKKSSETHRKQKGWDPMRDEHPLAIMFKKQKGRKK